MDSVIWQTLMGEDSAVQRSVSKRMALVIGARRHLEWGHEKYIIDTIQSHPAQVKNLFSILYTLILMLVLTFIVLEFCLRHFCLCAMFSIDHSVQLLLLPYFIGLPHLFLLSGDSLWSCLAVLSSLSSFLLGYLVPFLNRYEIYQLALVVWNLYNLVIVNLIVGCSWWGGWKFAKSSRLSSGLLAYFYFQLVRICMLCFKGILSVRISYLYFYCFNYFLCRFV